MQQTDKTPADIGEMLSTRNARGTCVSRHNALLMAELPVTADPDIFLFIAAVQFPIYLIPTLLQPLYRRLLPSPA